MLQRRQRDGLVPRPLSGEAHWARIRGELAVGHDGAAADAAAVPAPEAAREGTHAEAGAALAREGRGSKGGRGEGRREEAREEARDERQEDARREGRREGGRREGGRREERRQGGEAERDRAKLAGIARDLAAVERLQRRYARRA